MGVVEGRTATQELRSVMFPYALTHIQPDRPTRNRRIRTIHADTRYIQFALTCVNSSNNKHLVQVRYLLKNVTKK
jgi:hypothetical protein